MRCISKRKCRIYSVLLIICLCFTGCGISRIDNQYNLDSTNSSYIITSGADKDGTVKSFARDLCVSENDLNLLDLTIQEAEAAGLFDATAAETLYAKNIHKQMNPASLTKVMTAYLALKYGHLDDTLTASSNVIITESGAQLLGIKEGDRMSLEQALYALLLYSANDAAVMIAEYLSGSVESFSKVMTDEANKLGATNTNFSNPHGLTDETHYTTVYDLYLIFNAAMQYEEFRKIISTSEYKSTYKNREGNDKNIEINNTNGYINGTYTPPENVTVIGGKTGTTNAAGSCLILLSNSNAGHTYVSVILHSESHETLYNNMTTLLDDIP